KTRTPIRKQHLTWKYKSKTSILKASRTQQPELDGVTLKLYADLAPSTLQKRRDLKPLTDRISHYYKLHITTPSL
uniref:Uncharacterized protein n=1 Tax=Xenopus tropicalis TaxID=8364 RepID=A0A803J2A2_XENTR